MPCMCGDGACPSCGLAQDARTVDVDGTMGRLRESLDAHLAAARADVDDHAQSHERLYQSSLGRLRALLDIEQEFFGGIQGGQGRTSAELRESCAVFEGFAIAALCGAILVALAWWAL